MPTTLQWHFDDAISPDAGFAAFSDACLPFQTSGSVANRTRTTQIPAAVPEIQWFDATGGGPVAWMSGYVVAPFSLAGQIEFVIRALESATSVNVGLRVRVFKIPFKPTGSGGAVLVGTFSRAGEIATTLTQYTWTGTPASAVPFARNDRILVKGYFYAQGGTIGAGTGDVSINTSGTIITLTEDVLFSPVPLFDPPIARFNRLAKRHML